MRRVEKTPPGHKTLNQIFKKKKYRRGLSQTDLTFTQHPSDLANDGVELPTLILPPIKHPAHVPLELTSVVPFLPVWRVELTDREAHHLVRPRGDGDEMVAERAMRDNVLCDRIKLEERLSGGGRLGGRRGGE